MLRFTQLILAIQLGACQEKTGAGATPQPTPTTATLQLPSGVRDDDLVWNDEARSLTFASNRIVDFSTAENPDDDLHGFYWTVPPVVTKIVIGANTTIHGGFRFTSPTTIEGIDNKTSIIDGTPATKWSYGPNRIKEHNSLSKWGDDRAFDNEKWMYGAISVLYLAPSAQRTFTASRTSLSVTPGLMQLPHSSRSCW